MLCSWDCNHQLNRHHFAWPKSWYQKGVAKKYRELPCNIKKMCVEVHKEIHHILNPPPKPSHTVMRMAIEQHETGWCPCSQKST